MMTTTSPIRSIIEDLPGKPLQEAIFEMHWELNDTNVGPFSDPDYQVLFANLLTSLHNDYPVYVPLELAKVGIYVPWGVQHQFRAKNVWPVVQLGPGILTLNETDAYKWVDFEPNVKNVLKIIFAIWGDKRPPLKTLVLRYIDAINFDYHNSPLDFLAEKFKFCVTLPESLFGERKVERAADEFDLKLSFRHNALRSSVDLRFTRGKLREQDALVWETGVRLKEASSMKGAEEVAAWLSGAHEVIHDWFFKMIEGDLFGEFSKPKV